MYYHTLIANRHAHMLKCANLSLHCKEKGTTVCGVCVCMCVFVCVTEVNPLSIQLWTVILTLHVILIPL